MIERPCFPECRSGGPIPFLEIYGQFCAQAFAIEFTEPVSVRPYWALR